MSYSSALDKRDLLTVFGLDKKIQIKDFFHNQIVLFENLFGENIILIMRFLMLKIDYGQRI